MSGFYIVGEERIEMTVDPAYWWEGPSTWRSPYRYERVMVPVLRDANELDGLWQAMLPHLVAEVDLHGRTVMVPMYEPDPERAAWRRRKWWGRGPVKPLGGGCVKGDAWCAQYVACMYPECLPF